MFQRLAVVLFCLILPCAALGQDRQITLSAPQALIDSGLMKFVLPRFSLKTSIRIELLASNGAPLDPARVDVVLVDGVKAQLKGGPKSARPVFEDAEAVVYGFVLTRARDGDDRAGFAGRFADWLTSETGIRTIESFRVGEEQPYRAATAEAVDVAVAAATGDVVLGEKLSLQHCGRCHVVSEKNRMNGLGSTPSFRALKALSDWDYRFQVFHVLNPHPSFTQIEGITDPFDPMLPSPIAPLELTQEDVEAIMAFVAGVKPADLGAPVQAQ